MNINRWLFRRFWLPVYRVWALRHIRREQEYRYRNLRLHVPPGVFHPGVFFSTPIFLDFIKTLDVKGKTVLDVGTGSGALALLAAQKGARVTALDINPMAVKTARQNAARNALELLVLHSDLFDQFPAQLFDVVLINPPYYPQTPRSAAEQAFFAGPHHEYFEKLFRQLPAYFQPGGRAYMVLSEDCHLEKIRELAGQNRLFLRLIRERKKWGEQQWIFKITPEAATS